MTRSILMFGVIAGLIVNAPMMFFLVVRPVKPYVDSLFFGYLVMLLALSMVFVCVKRHRDGPSGGAIRFLPAFLMGLGVSIVAGAFYVLGWEIYQAAAHYPFADDYARASLAAAHAKAVTPARLAQLTAEMARFKTQYANPLYRLPMTFMEIFPVGLLVSLISAGLLCNRRFMPVRA